MRPSPGLAEERDAAHQRRDVDVRRCRALLDCAWLHGCIIIIIINALQPWL
jgi:hypothetical protein